MKALLLAAGRGTRLRPYSDLLPKCLMPIQGKILMDYWFCQLEQAGITSYVVNTHYMADMVRLYLSRHRLGSKITITHEELLLNTGGTLLANRQALQDEAFMLVHADNLSICDFGAFIHAHHSRPAGTIMTAMTFDAPDPTQCGIFEIDDYGVAQSFHEKVSDPPGCLANGAVYIIEPEIFDYLEGLGKQEIDFSCEVIPAFMGKINTFHNADYHRDIGTPESLLQAQTDGLGPGSCASSESGQQAMSHDQLRTRVEKMAITLSQ